VIFFTRLSFRVGFWLDPDLDPDPVVTGQSVYLRYMKHAVACTREHEVLVPLLEQGTRC
jgi:hypothetical protein